jgi:oligoendopeptidase F
MKKSCQWLIMVLMMSGNQFILAAGDQDQNWNLEDIYASPGQWDNSKQRLEDSLAEIDKCRGQLGKNARKLAQCMALIWDKYKTLLQLQVYASLSADKDLRDENNAARDRSIELLATEFYRVSSFVDPELLAAGSRKLEQFLRAEMTLQPYSVYIREVLRRKDHVLDAEGESLLAAAGTLTSAPYTTYSTFANADLPWPSITLRDGEQVRLDQAAYTKHRGADDRQQRRQVFRSFFGELDHYKRTLASLLNAQVNSNLFEARARHYPNALISAIDHDDIPEQVYRTLIESVNDNLGTLHRYFRLRGRILGVQDLRYYDIYPPLVSLDKSFYIEEGKKLTLHAARLLGEEYTSVMREGFASRWMDVYPGQGKRSGAYMNGSAYDVHPYVLLNYNDGYDDVSTLAHEWGHAMHSWLASKNQPFAKADYPTFMAEIASTFNEHLLLETMLDEAENDQQRLFYLGHALEAIRGTFFRQAMFSEFELAIHEVVENGEALTGDKLNVMYLDLLKRYHGHAQGVLTVDDLYAVEWAYIPHFYYNFYVYQYATSIAASSLLADRVIARQEGARDNYLKLLKAGGSDNAYQLLKEAGVDMATPAPYEATVKRMNSIMDQIEAILDKQENNT